MTFFSPKNKKIFQNAVKCRFYSRYRCFKMLIVSEDLINASTALIDLFKDFINVSESHIVVSKGVINVLKGL